MFDVKKLLRSPVFIAGLVAVLLVGGLVAVRGCAVDRDHQEHQQEQEHVEPRAPGGLLLFVSDKRYPRIEQDLLMREMPAFCKAHDLEGFRWLDDCEDQGLEAIKHAGALNVSPPFVAHVKEGRMLRATHWPANQTDLEKWLR